MEAHQAAKVFPTIAAADLERLCNSVMELGLKEPIKTLHGKVLDGRSRLIACQSTATTPRFIEADLSEYGGCPYRYVVAHNFARRNLSPTQIAFVAGQLVESGVYEMDGEGQICPRRDSDENAAAVSGVSARSVRKARKVIKEGSEDVGNAVASGDLSLDGAEQLIDAVPDKQRQSAIVKQAVASGAPRASVRKTVKRLSDTEDDSFDTATFETNGHAKPKKNGKPTVASGVRKKALAEVNNFCRTLHKLGIYEEFIMPLSQIIKRIETL